MDTLQEGTILAKKKTVQRDYHSKTNKKRGRMVGFGIKSRDELASTREERSTEEITKEGGGKTS